MFFLSLQTCQLAQDFRCDLPRTRVSGVGGVIPSSAVVCYGGWIKSWGSTHAQPTIDMTDSSTVPTKANAQGGNRLAAPLETETGLAG